MRSKRKEERGKRKWEARGKRKWEARGKSKWEARGKSKWEARELLEKTFWKKLLKKRRRRSSSFFDFLLLEGESARIVWKIRIGSDFFLMPVVCWNFSSNIGYICRQSFRNSFWLSAHRPSLPLQMRGSLESLCFAFVVENIARLGHCLEGS